MSKEPILFYCDSEEYPDKNIFCKRHCPKTFVPRREDILYEKEINIKDKTQTFIHSCEVCEENEPFSQYSLAKKYCFPNVLEKIAKNKKELQTKEDNIKNDKKKDILDSYKPKKEKYDLVVKKLSDILNRDKIKKSELRKLYEWMLVNSQESDD